MVDRDRRPKLDLGVTIDREPGGPTCSFKEVFRGFERVRAVREIFRESTDEILSALRVRLTVEKGYLYVDDERGMIVVSSTYLRSGEKRYLYLDVIHELVHIRQLREGKELFDKRYVYVRRPTEIEAYRTTVKEARRIGMSDEEIAEYLRVEWVTELEFREFLGTLGIQTGTELQAP